MECLTLERGQGRVKFESHHLNLNLNLSLPIAIADVFSILLRDFCKDFRLSRLAYRRGQGRLHLPISFFRPAIYVI